MQLRKAEMSSEIKNAPRWIAGIEPAPEVLKMNGTQVLEMECREQPKRLAELIVAYAEDETVRGQLRALTGIVERPGPVLWLGMGGSLCSSYAGSALMQTHGRMAFSVDAGEWLHYGISTWGQAAGSVVLTTSGESAEIVELFKVGAGHDSEGPMALICNNEASKCWSLAEKKLPILAGPEYGNATKSYTNATAAAILAASEMMGIDWKADAERAQAVVASELDGIFAMRGKMDAFCKGAANIELVGRGAAYGAAVMGALTIREMSGFRAAAHTGAGFKHGPNLDVDGTHVAMIFALGRAAGLGVKLADECVRRAGKVVLVSSEEHARTPQVFPVKLSAVREPWEGVTAILVAQALTLAMVERMGCRLPPRFQYGVMEQ
jgi:glucosamine--fructose-6-phosphate aminotransferase (isomerizing)